MIEFIQAGGVPIFAVLLFGAITLLASALFAGKPSEAKVAFIRAMSVATIFATAAAVASSIAAVMSNVPNHPEWSKSPEIHLIVMTGIGESMASAILGFAMLALAWLVTAVGVRRLAYRMSA
jgi:hypothetical protein